MAEVLTTKYKTDAVRLMYDDIVNASIYVFVSGIERYSINPVNSLSSGNEFLAKTLFGKRIRPEDTKFMVKYIPWNNGDVYIRYDDAADLEDERFYAVVGPTNNDTGDYRVYKCLFNNYGGPVSSPPNFEETVESQIYRTADGYVWKHLYAISLIEFEAYNALGYIPIVGNFEIDPVANTTIKSTVSDIAVENREINFGYVEVPATAAGSPLSTGEIQVTSDVLRENIAYHRDGYFIGQTLKAKQAQAPGQTFTYRIIGYEWDEAFLRGIFFVDGDPSGSGDAIGGNANITIAPTILIQGDGTGAVAIPTIIEGRIDSIQVLEQGSGYNNAIATVVDPLYDFDPEDTTTIDIRADIRPILSPSGDHGYNLLDELKCKHFLLYGYITGDDNTQIGATNTYNGVGIIKSPSFANTELTYDIFDNRISVVTDDIPYLAANGIITQVNQENETIFEGKIHELDLTSNTVYIAEYTGRYPSNANSGFGDTSFDLNLPLRNSAGTLIQITTPVANNVVFSEYIQRTGEVYYMEDFFPLERNDLSREEFKIVLEF